MFKKKANAITCDHLADDGAWIMLHSKLMHYIKVVYELVTFNYSPELTVDLAAKLYSVIQK